MVFMLRHGYINENYADYINYFHPGSITKEELNFILWIRDLVNQSMVSLKFTKAYIDRGINIEQFIRLLCHASPLIWTEFMYDEQLSLKKKNQYFKLIINACDVYDIENNNVGYEDEERGIYSEGVVKEYFEDQENILHELASVSWNKIKQVIDELGIRFKYVHDEFQEYVRVFIIGEESNTEEGKEFVDAILQRIFEENTALFIKVIEKEHLAYWNKLMDCLKDFEDKGKQEIWDCLLQNNRTDASWDNYLDYHALFGLTEVLLRYFDENIDAVLRSDSGEGIADEIVKELITADLSDISFEKLIVNCRIDEFTNEFSEFSENRLKILVQNHYFKFTPEKLLEIKGISRSLGTEFICENVSAFLACMEQCNIDLTDIKGIIELKIFNKENLLRVLNFVEPMDVDKEFALLAKDLNFILPKEYVEAIWQVLDEQDKYQFLYVQMEVSNDSESE